MELSCFKSFGGVFHSPLPQDAKHSLLIEFTEISVNWFFTWCHGHVYFSVKQLRKITGRSQL